jgi:hypothetical protein
LENAKKITRNLNQDSRSPGQDLSPGLPNTQTAYYSEATCVPKHKKAEKNETKKRKTAISVLQNN